MGITGYLNINDLRVALNRRGIYEIYCGQDRTEHGFTDRSVRKSSGLARRTRRVQ